VRTARRPFVARADWLAAAALGLMTFAVFGVSAGRLGFYGDDGGWLTRLTTVAPSQIWDVVRHYMPGRNLHPLWHYLLYQIVGDPFEQLPMLHLVQAALDGLVVATFFLLLRVLGILAAPAWIGAVVFAFWPFRGETHFWLESLPMNLLSTFWTLLAGITSVLLLRGHRTWRVWALDCTAFLCALFTYDQVLLVLIFFLVLRTVLLRTPAVLLGQLPYFAALAFMVWLRVSQGGGPLPRAEEGLAAVIAGNIRETALRIFGPPAIDLARLQSATATGSDRLLALAIALAATAGGWLLWSRKDLGANLRQGPHAQNQQLALLLAALAFWGLAYFPIWLWWPAPRHHYLPSVGMFAAGAVVLAWIAARLSNRAVRAALLLGFGGLTFLTTAACRGESRLWERSYLARRQVFTELRPHLDDVEIVVLEDFPFVLGPALFVTPQDPDTWVRFLTRGVPRRGHLIGALSSAPAPGGVFTNTAYGDNPPAFEYWPTDKFLAVRFTGWRPDRESVEYLVNAARLPYEVLSSSLEAAAGGSAVRRFAARREGEDLVVTLDVLGTIRAQGYLTAVFGFRERGRWQRWGRRNLDGNSVAQPVLLSDPGPQPRAGSFRWNGVLRLHDFPATDRVRIELHHTISGHNPLLAQAEVTIPAEPVHSTK
jgi:hypothetical protein